jgi:NAD(P)-dependent dehydrogenase (short-subunit alcohol dehydrogenase family)
VAGELRSRFGKVDAVVLDAGIGRMLPVKAVDEAAHDEHFAVNVKGQFFTLQKLLPLIEPGASIIFTSLVGSHVGAPNWSVYTATKGALMAMVRALTAELAPRNIRVNSVSPGPIDNARVYEARPAACGLGQVQSTDARTCSAGAIRRRRRKHPRHRIPGLS